MSEPEQSLVVIEELERFVKQHPGTADKKKRSMEWPASLEVAGEPGE